VKNRPKVLVYVRDYFWDIYQDMFKGLESYELVQITDFIGRGVEAINPIFHRQFAGPDISSHDLDEGDVIRRCRLLRNLPRSRARRMVRAMHYTLLPIIQREPWVLIAGQTVDDYITHILALLAARHSIPYIGFCSSYFPGYTQLSLGWTGSYAAGRTAVRAEAEKIEEMVSGDRFRQDYNILVHYDRWVHYRRVARYWFKRVYFELLRRVRRAPNHIHYLLQPYLGQQKRLDFYPPSDAFHIDWEKKWHNSGRHVVYMPLGHTPEAGTDYMIRDVRYIEYEETILRIATRLGREFIVLVKDHFHMLGVRDPKFYTALRQVPGVVVVPPTVNSNALLSKGIDRVLVGAGSVGIEATIRGKIVFTFSDTACWLQASGARHLRLDELEYWPHQIMSFRPERVPAVNFVQQCLGTTLNFDYMIAQDHDGRKGRQVGLFFDQFLTCAESRLT